MKLYFAGAESLRFQEILKSVGVKKCLVSYYHVRKDANLYEHYKGMEEIFLDSGAYSAYHQGVEIDLQEYITFIKNQNLTLYANLDVIGSWQKTLENQTTMERAGLHPLPVWHMKDPFDALKQLCKDYQYVGLSVSQSESTHTRAQVASTIFESFPDTKFHCFALTQPKLMIEHPFYSVDSTTWLNSGKYGALITPWGYLHLGQKESSSRFLKKSREQQIKWQAYLKMAGFDIKKLLEDSSDSYIEKLRCSAKFFLCLEDAINSFPQPQKRKKMLDSFMRSRRKSK